MCLPKIIGIVFAQGMWAYDTTTFLFQLNKYTQIHTHKIKVVGVESYSTDHSIDVHYRVYIITKTK